jgi:hypothetical protein
VGPVMLYIKPHGVTVAVSVHALCVLLILVQGMLSMFYEDK